MSNRASKSGWEFMAGCLLLILIIPLSVVTKAWAFQVLWGWFMVRAFPALPSLSLPLCIGLVEVAYMLVPYQPLADKKDSEDFWEQIGKMFGRVLLYPALALFTGWIALRFV